MKSRTRTLSLLLLLVCVLTSSISSGGANNSSNKSFTSYPIHVDAGWNLVSLPVEVLDGTKAVLFPTAVSPAFEFQNSYIPKDSLEPGVGYWMNFSSPQEILIEGDTVLDRAIPVRAGWNMIGSLSVPMPVSHIYTEPEGIISSKFFRYAGGTYQVADTLHPAQGHWVQVQQDGTLFLTTPGGAEGAISDSARSVILDSINAFVNRLPHTNDDSDNLALLAYLRSIPQFEAADTLMDGVWARFIDGRMFVRANDLHFAGGALGLPTGIIPKPREVEQVASPTDNLPTSSTAWICNALGSLFYNEPGGGVTATVDQLREWHTLTGYTLSPNGGATVGDLKSVSGVGVFYISAHGAGCYDRNNNPVYGVWTSTVREPLFDAVLRRDLDNGYLVYFSAPNIDDGSGGSIEETHYAITEKFVQKYMNFQKGAVVFMNSCWSYYEHNFAQACLGKGAGFYVGWTRSVNGVIALRAARHFFDRMLGTNKFFPETPPQRPFDADLVWNDLILKGYDTSSTKGGPSKFTIDPAMPDVNLLAPSILQAYKDPIPGFDDFYIDGLFGNNPGAGAATVKVGGTSLNITWVNSTKLKLDLPPHGGDVQVTVRGRKSNITQYTEWHGVFDYTLTGRGSLKQHIVMNVDFLADVHSFRINIGVPPIYPFARYIQVLNTSHATYECSGEYRNPNDTALVEETWSGAGSVPLGDGPPGFGFSTAVGPPGNPNLALLSFSAEYLVNTSPTPLSLPDDVAGNTLTMSTAYVIGGGSISAINSDGSYVMTWSDMTPVYPPDPNGAR